MHTNTAVALNPNFMSSLLLRAVFLLKKFHNKDPKLFAFHIFCLLIFIFLNF